MNKKILIGFTGLIALTLVMIFTTVWILHFVRQDVHYHDLYTQATGEMRLLDEEIDYVQVPEVLNEDMEQALNEYDNPSYNGMEDIQNGLSEKSDELEYLDIIPVFKAEPLPEHIIEFITGWSFREDTPFSYDYLAYLTITHVNFNGENQIGHLIVADKIADEVLEIFREIFDAEFPIYSIKLIEYFDTSDYYSMVANNSHAFNFRYIAGTRTISRHGFGMAIDINPIQNPYIRGEVILPDAGRAYLDRDDVRPGMIVSGDAVYMAFISRGWIWGGNWRTLRDYHHFERRG